LSAFNPSLGLEFKATPDTSIVPLLFYVLGRKTSSHVKTLFVNETLIRVSNFASGENTQPNIPDIWSSNGIDEKVTAVVWAFCYLSATLIRRR